MREELKTCVAFVAALLLLTGFSNGLHGIGWKPPASFKAGYVNPDALTLQPAQAKERVRQAAALAAGTNGVSLVLDQNDLVEGGINLTAEVNRLLQSGQSFSPAPESNLPCYPIGIVNEKTLLSLPQIAAARGGYLRLLGDLKKNGGGDEAHDAALLQGYQENTIRPLLERLHQAILRVARQQGLWVVFSSSQVIYGGIDITPLVVSNWNSADDGEKETAGLQESGFSPDPQIGVVDEEKAAESLPLSLKLSELDREIASWESGRYGMAETLVPASAWEAWETAREKAQASLQREVSEASIPYRKEAELVSQLPRQDQLLVQQAGAYFNQTLSTLLRARAQSAQAEYVQDVKREEAESQKELSAYASSLLKERNKALRAYQDLLIAKAQAKLQAKAAELQLGAGKGGGMSNASKEALLHYQDVQVAKLKEDLKSAAASLDREAMKKIARFRGNLAKQSLASLRQKEAALRNALEAYRKSARQKAERAAAAKFGSRAALIASRLIPDNQGNESQEGLTATEQEMEERLSAGAAEILSRSPRYQEVILKIHQGDGNAVPAVIEGLKKEREETARQMKMELASLVKSAADKRGVQAVVAGVLVNVSAPDFTSQISQTPKF